MASFTTRLIDTLLRFRVLADPWSHGQELWRIINFIGAAIGVLEGSTKGVRDY